MTLEIIVFIGAILLGIVWYWRESKSNKLYRLANKITHAKDLQMKPENRKGFVHQQPFLLRLVWIGFIFLIGVIFAMIIIPFNVVLAQYFVASVVGALTGTYIASAVIFAKDSTSKENIEKVFDKGKEMVEDLVDGDDEVVKESKVEEKMETPKKEEVIERELEAKKSARDRLKDKGMIK